MSIFAIISGVPKKRHVSPTAYDFCLAKSFILKFSWTQIKNVLHEFTISLKLINYEQNGMTLKLLPPIGKFRMRDNGAHTTYDLQQSHNSNAWNF